jgi:hypothetical protein
LRSLFRWLLIPLIAVAVGACESSPLLAPLSSTISVFSSATVLRPGETAEVSAVVTEEAGTTVQDGTVVRFFATLGAVAPAEVKTRGGVARTTFTAGSNAGTARVTATSGVASSATDQPNVVDITIEF